MYITFIRIKSSRPIERGFIYKAIQVKKTLPTYKTNKPCKLSDKIIIYIVLINKINFFITINDCAYDYLYDLIPNQFCQQVIDCIPTLLYHSNLQNNLLNLNPTKL